MSGIKFLMGVKKTLLYLFEFRAFNTFNDEYAATACIQGFHLPKELFSLQCYPLEKNCLEFKD